MRGLFLMLSGNGDQAICCCIEYGCSKRFSKGYLSRDKYSNNDVYQASRQTRSSTNIVIRVKLCCLQLLHST